jgi:hypothetical protein
MQQNANIWLQDLKSMKLSNLLLGLLVAATIVGFAAKVRANNIQDGTYVFFSTDGDTALDGSTVTVASDIFVSWHLVDSLFPYPLDLPLTPSNSFIVSSGVLGPSAGYFVIDSNNIASDPFASFEGQNALFGDLGNGSVGSLYDGNGDPIGDWVRVSAPDASSTIQLLAGALLALAAGRSFMRRVASDR